MSFSRLIANTAGIASLDLSARPTGQGTVDLPPFRLQFINLAPDRGPSIVTEVEIQASDASGAMSPCEDRNANPNDRIADLDSESHEVFSRWKADRSRKHT